MGKLIVGIILYTASALMFCSAVYLWYGIEYALIAGGASTGLPAYAVFVAFIDSLE